MKYVFKTNYSQRLLTSCNLCPRGCGANRLIGELGYCKIDSKPVVASIVLHRGEEPVISGDKGICNVFFAHCNLTCIYCQNNQISRNSHCDKDWLTDYDDILESITRILNQGINILGFVSPTHQVAQMLEILNRLSEQGYNPRIVYNTNSYDNPLVLRELNGIIDVYLPDIKYFSNELAKRYSDADNYFNYALKTLREMIWQKGTSLVIDRDGLIESGVIVRHLILPGHVDDSKIVFEHLASEFGAQLTISLLSQYHPNRDALTSNGRINRVITASEYNDVVNKLNELGFYRGWLQDLDSNNQYLPDFSKEEPFF